MRRLLHFVDFTISCVKNDRFYVPSSKTTPKMKQMTRLNLKIPHDHRDTGLLGGVMDLTIIASDENPLDHLTKKISAALIPDEVIDCDIQRIQFENYLRLAYGILTQFNSQDQSSGSNTTQAA